jgi:hypothetical protein
MEDKMQLHEIISLLDKTWPLLVILSGFLGGIIKKWLMRNEKLSDATIAILTHLKNAGITTENITVILGRVSAFNDLDDAGKQAMAKDELLTLGKRNGVIIPDSIANDIITWLWVKTKTSK